MPAFSYADILGDRAVTAFDMRNIILTRDTRHQRVHITSHPVHGKSLFLDGTHQSSEEDEWIYHEMLVHPAMQHFGEPSEVAIIGSAEGAGLREILRYPSVRNAHMCDIDEELIDICRSTLGWDKGAMNDSRSRVIGGDGVKWLKSRDGGSLDVLIFDLLEPDSAQLSDHFYTPAILHLASAKLSTRGIFATHAGPCHNACVNSVAATYRAVSKVFPHVRLSLCPELRWAYIIASLTEFRGEPYRPVAGISYYNRQLHDTFGSVIPEYLVEAIR